MPTFKFTSPDGKRYSVDGPDGATEQEAFQMLQSQLGAGPQVPAPAKPFGQQLNDNIADIPRQAGLTARYGIEGVGGALNMLATPVRAGLNLLLPKQQTLPGLVAGASRRDAIQPINFKGLADAVGLPEPRNALERVVSDASRTVAGGLVPMAAAGRIAQGASGVTKGVAQTLSANPLQQLVSAGSAGGAGGYVRETGGNDSSQMLASVAAGVAAPLAMNKLSQVAGAVGRMARPQAPPPAQIDIHINNALQPSGMTLNDLPASVQAGIRKDVTEAFNIGGSVTPMAVRRLADYRLTGATPTAAGLTDNPAVITQQRNLAKLGINSKDSAAQALGQTENANNRVLISGLNDLGAGTPDTAISGGRRVMGALSSRNDAAKSAIDARYAAARATDGRSAALDPHTFSNRANDALDEALLGGKLPADVRSLLNKAASGKMPLTVDTAEQFKTRIGDLQRSSTDASERKALGLVRQALDDTPLLDGQGQDAINAFNRARSLNRAWMGIVEKTPALQAVRDGIEPDKFVQQFIVGGGAKANVADLAALRQSVKASPDALQAVREQIAAHLKAKALNGAADEVGNLSQSAYNKSLNAIGDEKLALFFTRPEVDQLRAIGRVASYEQVQPRGSAVNNSNTAAAIGNIFDRLAASSLLSKVPFGKSLQEPIQNIAVGFKSSAAMNAPKALAGNALQRAAGRPVGLAMSPAVLMQQQEEN
ncbi:hypothetical protein [Janthinobacterium sp. LM6]|uniref:hypothetical protein n=1 Tax=Janthinobacterium sp. LM6 TaxID=1938606 RepID=UPI00123744DF|nr:hypothetical protein [Janthinobacterium sp. LM6]